MAFTRTLPSTCHVCGTPDRPHKANGMCNNCYMRDYFLKRKRAKTLAKQADSELSPEKT